MDKQDPELIATLSSSQNVQSAAQISQNKLRCVSSNPVSMMCLNVECTHKNAFQCDKLTCQCRVDHKKCQKGDSQDVFSYVYSKIHHTKKFIDAIKTTIQQKVDQLKALVPVFIEEIENRYKFTDLHDLERKFLKIVKGEGQVKVEDFSPLESKKIWQSARTFNKNKKTDIFDRLMKHVNQFSNSITSDIANVRNGFNSELILQENYNKMVPEPISSKQLEFQDIALSSKIIENSAICKTKLLSGLLVKMFTKKITKMECIFTASKNEFSIAKYFEICGAVPNTVIIGITNKEKIIGGYSPLAHDQENNDANATDETGESFLFSLTDEEKFILKENSQAIYRFKQKTFIRFGNAAELQICDKANTQNCENCLTNVNYGAYYNPAYSVNDKPAYLKFNGNETANFSLTEWEVWKVEF